MIFEVMKASKAEKERVTLQSIGEKTLRVNIIEEETNKNCEKHFNIFLMNWLHFRQRLRILKKVILMTVRVDVTALKRKAYLTAIIALILVVGIILVNTTGKFKIMETR